MLRVFDSRTRVACKLLWSFPRSRPSIPELGKSMVGLRCMGKFMRSLGYFVALGMYAANATSAVELPPSETRVKIFDRVVSEIERIDGEGLPPRKNRPEEWKTTTKKLREMARLAASPIDFGQVFRKLDATYPNLHAQVVLDEKFDIMANRSRPRIGIRFAPEKVEAKQKRFHYRINSIETDTMKDFKEAARPGIGDELLAINDRSMGEWSTENFLYCKFPLREQCEANISDHFRRALLSWDWRAPLKYTLKRNERVWSIQVPVEMPATGSKPFISSAQAQAGDGECSADLERYEGFNVTYKGLNICSLESSKYPGVSVLAIASFRYRDLPKESKIRSLKDEVDQFYEGYWKAKAPVTKKLIIDLIDNGGGDTPIEWYRIFYSKPFQEQYVEFRKLPELDDNRIRKDLFYDDPGKEIWFKELRDAGVYQKIKTGAFLPTIPQFCASEDQSCAKGLFTPRPNGFKGQVRILVNEWCISTCTGFVWSLRQQLGARTKIFGIPESGDSAYARLFLDIYLDPSKPDGFRSEVAPRPGGSRQALPEGAILRQQVAVTRSTDASGKVISAIPSPVDVWIPYRYRHFDESWEAKVFKAALNQ